MAHGTRTRRVGERVRTELSVLLLRSVRDPGVTGVTVTEVRMTPDLQLARVYYTLAHGGDRRDAARALRRARPYLRRNVGERLQLRQAPDLRFLYDDSADKQDRMARIFDEIAQQRGADPEAADEPAAADAAGTGVADPDTARAAPTASRSAPEETDGT